MKQPITKEKPLSMVCSVLASAFPANFFLGSPWRFHGSESDFLIWFAVLKSRVSL